MERADTLVRPIRHLVDGELDRKIVDVDGKEWIVHSHAQQLFHRSRLLWSDDPQAALRVERWSEERNALDVIPVEMRQQQIHFEWGLAAAVHHRHPELPEAGA